MATHDDIMAAITNESASAKTTDSLYKEAKTNFATLEKAYFDLRGLKFDGGAKGLVKELLPRLMSRMGIPGGMGLGALGATLLADEGGFSSFMAKIPVLGQLLGVFGL